MDRSAGFRVAHLAYAQAAVERGEVVLGGAPFGKWRTLTFIAALRHDRIDAPCVLDGPINGQSFAAWVEQFLVPTLKPGDIVIIDNPGSHQGPAVRQGDPRGRRQALVPAILLARPEPDRAGLRQLKLLLRKAAERSVQAAWQRIGSLLDAFPPHERANYLRNAGYASM